MLRPLLGVSQYRSLNSELNRDLLITKQPHSLCAIEAKPGNATLVFTFTAVQAARPGGGPARNRTPSYGFGIRLVTMSLPPWLSFVPSAFYVMMHAAYWALKRYCDDLNLKIKDATHIIKELVDIALISAVFTR